MGSHGIYGSLQLLSKFMRNRCSEEFPCWSQLLIISYLGVCSEDSLCWPQRAKKVKTEMASNNSKHSDKCLNTQSTWSALFCVSMKVNYLNILTAFSRITNTKDFIVFLEKVKRSMCFFEEQASPTEGTINGKHQEGRMRIKEWIWKTGEEHHSIS